jgi:cell division protein ZipA
MLSYILLFILITIVILGVVRASRQAQPGNARSHRSHKEPFVGVTQNEVVDEIEMVGEPRIVSRSHNRTRPVVAVSAVDYSEEIQEQTSASRRLDVSPKAARPQQEVSAVDASPLFESKPAPQKSTAVAEGEKLNDLVVLHLIAPLDSPYRGYELLQAMLTAGLRYGKWNIFHRHTQITGRGPILFSLASSVEPGTFDLAKMGSFSTAGLTIFMRTSNVENPGQALEMLWTATQQLVQELGGTVCDEKRVPLSPEKLVSWRSAIAN